MSNTRKQIRKSKLTVGCGVRLMWSIQGESLQSSPPPMIRTKGGLLLRIEVQMLHRPHNRSQAVREDNQNNRAWKHDLWLFLFSLQEA